MCVSMNIIEKLYDLIKQATTDHSHYYVKSVCEEAVVEIERLTKENKELQWMREGLEK